MWLGCRQKNAKKNNALKSHIKNIISEPLAHNVTINIGVKTVLGAISSINPRHDKDIKMYNPNATLSVA